jgi:hypothetical protein
MLTDKIVEDRPGRAGKGGTRSDQKAARRKGQEENAEAETSVHRAAAGGIPVS